MKNTVSVSTLWKHDTAKNFIWLAILTGIIVFSFVHSLSASAQMGTSMDKLNDSTCIVAIGNNAMVEDIEHSQLKLGAILLFSIPEDKASVHDAHLHTHSSGQMHPVSLRSVFKLVLMVCVSLSLVVCVIL